MIRFIWNNWWRRKERFILLIIGAFIVSAGLTYLIGLSESNRGTIVDTLQQRWSASYDIVVRPEGTRSVTEEKKLLEPNYMSGLSGGISVQQYETIKEIAGVEVAAPIAMIGYADYQVHYGTAELPEDGLYRRQTSTTVDNGLGEVTSVSNSYFPLNVWNFFDKGPEYGAGSPHLDLMIHSQTLLAGIDPEQEAKLVGLNQAIIDMGTSRYFEDLDSYLYNEEKGYHEFPILVNRQAFVEKVEEITFERLALPITKENANEVMEEVREKGGESYLDTIDGEIIESYSYTGEETFHTFVSEMTGVDWQTGNIMPIDEASQEEEEQVTGIVFKPSPIEYQEIASPYVDRWPYSYQVVPFQNGEDTVGVYRNQETFREPQLMAEEYLDLPRTKPNWIGFYDASHLDLSKDPTNELPMETYRPASAEFVMDAEGNPMNPPQQLKPNGDPYSFLSDPPGMLTTIEAAEHLLGEEPISAIRIKVAGITDMSDESQAILERVAAEIEEKTGLITDITLGSSPQLALTYVPGINEENEIGWLQQPWVNIGSSISIFRETKVGFSGIVSSVIAVAIVYVWSSGVVNLLARRKEFAVLLSIGWRPSQLNKLLFIESFIIGLFVALVSWMMLGFVYISSEAAISLTRFIWTGLFGLSVYLFGSIVPMIMTRNISPYEAMRSGEISSHSKRIVQARGIYRMAFNHFIGKWKRSILSVISIALPTALLAIFLYITLRLRGVMYTSLLGEYVALEVGTVHYVAIMIAFIIAVLTTAEIIWQNVSERRGEMALLQAIGWKRWSIRRLILAEGMFAGLLAAIIGLTVAFMMMWGLYGEFPLEEIGFILATGLIPVVIGLIGSIFPAEKAVRITPNQGVSGTYSNRKVVERRLKWTVLTFSVLLVGTFLYTMIQVAPNIEQVSSTVDVDQVSSPTTGNVTGDTSTNEEEQEDQEDQTTEIIDSMGTPGEYELEFSSEQTSESVGWGSMLSYSAQEVESQLPDADPGMKNVAIKFLFEIMDSMTFDMRLQQHFSLVVGEDSYRPMESTVLEEVSWQEERWLNGYRDGKMHAVLEFTIPEDVDRYGLLFQNFQETGKGYMIWFD